MVSILHVILVSIILWIIWKQRTRRQKHRLPPGPLCLPVIGSLHIFADKQKRPYEVLTELSKQYGKIFGLRMGSLYTVVISDPALAREALRREEYSGRAPLYLFHGMMDGKGIIGTEGTLWRDQRKRTITWLRHLGMLKTDSDRRLQLERRIMKQIDNGIEIVSTACRSNRVASVSMDLLPVISHVVGNVMNDLLFGITYKEEDEEWKYLIHLQHVGIEYLQEAAVVNFLPHLRFLPKYKRCIKFIYEGQRKTHAIYQRIIQETEAKLRASNYEATDESHDTTVVELFLRERHARSVVGPEFDDSHLKYLLTDVFGAGMDTTMSSVRWILQCLALFPEAQEKLHKELHDVLGDRNSVTLEDYESLVYLRSCIAEALRIRPVIPMGVPHGTTADTELAGFHIPKNTMVLSLQFAMHTNPDEWPEPELYKPERFYEVFASGGGGGGAPNALPFYMPFQVGKRMCLGEDLAKINLFLITGNFMRRFSLRVDDDRDLKTLMRGVDALVLSSTPCKFHIQEVKWRHGGGE